MNRTERNYESLYIVDATLTDDQLESIIEKYAKVVVDQGAQVQGAGRWDKRRLAYDVGGRGEGTYILMYFTAESAAVDELDRLFRIADDVFRHLIVRVDPERVDLSLIAKPQPPAEAPEEVPASEEPTEQPPADEAEPAKPEEDAAPPEEAEASAEPEAEPEPEPEPEAEPEIKPEAEMEPAEEPPAEDTSEEAAAAEEQPPAEEEAEEIPSDEQNTEPEKESE